MVKFKYYNSGSTFNSNALSNDDIAFVEDSKSIYTHGVEFKPNIYAEDVVIRDTIPNANGHAYVDLGLPSGTLWATMNVGASSETDYGNYYKYGYGSTQWENSSAGYYGTETPLQRSLDTANQVWGGGWHTPTQTQCRELINKTTVTITTIDNIKCAKFTAQNGNYIVLPFGGSCQYNYGSNPFNRGTYLYYMSSTPAGVNYIGGLNSSGASVSYTNYIARYSGVSVRPVLGPQQSITDVLKEQEQADWSNNNAASKGYIINKPSSLPASNFTVKYYSKSTNSSANTPTITNAGCATYIYYNSASSAITLTLPTTSSYIIEDGVDSIEIPAGGYAEVSFAHVYISSDYKYLVRSWVSD